MIENNKINVFAKLRAPLIYGLLFVLWVVVFDMLLVMLAPWLPERTRIITRTPLYVLAYQHVILAGVSTLLALMTAMLAAICIRWIDQDELKSIGLSIGALGETVPSVAVIALAVPIMGYGNLPCILALYLYGLLPILRNTLIGMDAVSQSVKEAAVGMGLSTWQRIWHVELPLSKNVWLAGIRTALVINISAATIGATVGAGGFGVPIIAGIRVHDPIMVIQGSIPVMLLALMADGFLRKFETQEVVRGA